MSNSKSIVTFTFFLTTLVMIWFALPSWTSGLASSPALSGDMVDDEKSTEIAQEKSDTFNRSAQDILGVADTFYIRAKTNGATEKQTALGVHTRRVDPTLAAHVKLPNGVGLVIEHVVAGSAAESGDLQLHDIIHKMNDQILVNVEQLATLVRNQKPGDGVKLSIVRNGKNESIELKLGETESSQSLEWFDPKGEKIDGSKLPWSKTASDSYNPHKKIPHAQLTNCSRCHGRVTD